MTNTVQSHQAHVSEGSAKEESGLSAAFWQERYDAQADDTLSADQVPQTMQASACTQCVHMVCIDSQRDHRSKQACMFLVCAVGCTHRLICCCALCRYGGNAVGPVRTLPVMRSFTFLRLIPDMMSPEYQTIWFSFMNQMQQIQSSEHQK